MTSSPDPTRRLAAVDTLRGLAMALMALDHTRDFLHAGSLHGLDPLDPATTTPGLFLTRWITHFCAPTFFLLAGAGARLSHARGRSTADLSRYLVTRGAWLILLEWTVVQWLGWTWKVDLRDHYGMVLWALGCSMILLGGLVHLPDRAVTALALALLAGHNALDAVRPEDLGPLAPLWSVLHVSAVVDVGAGHRLLAAYPLVPWVGVMALGWVLGAWLLRTDPATRRRRLAATGATCVGAFLLLRITGFYGDPSPWTPTGSLGASVASFLSCTKYPPSLCFLLMTLGPVLLLLAVGDRPQPAWTRPLQTLGRVPLFFYLLHLPLLHAMAWAASVATTGSGAWLFGSVGGKAPPDAGFGLPVAWLGWLLCLALLFPACRWYAASRARHPGGWRSYL